jgi:hypothetical protein
LTEAMLDDIFTRTRNLVGTHRKNSRTHA